ncbi:hypothetical protein MKY15_16720 [Sporosarcina sp. FSL K6-1540]|uniref:Uncharacterized protein n=1 Tax=Sporosarcina psychrophila TaxID=1476 RepID=A0ABV2K651_SPOPS|nr:hypothetical protein [Sporosarcina sp. resist]QNK90053.1 hypothetical protein H7992_10600 [Sporosarcina sp. resist]
MEQIIIFIILAIVGSFFRGKKKDPAEGPKPKPSTATGNAPEGPTTKLKEMYRELQREMAGADAEPPIRQLPKQQQQATVTVPSAPVVVPPARPTADRKERTNSSANRHIERPDSSVNRHSGRLSAHGGQRPTVSAIQSHDLMPKSQGDLLKGIVFSEIYGPPKSKR